MLFSITGDNAITAPLVLSIGTLPPSATVKVRNVRLFSGHDNIAVMPPSPPMIAVKGRTLNVSLPSKTGQWTIMVLNLQGNIVAGFKITGSKSLSLRNKDVFPKGAYIIDVMGWRDQNKRIVLD
ncbi:MAG: hypothetical protein LBH93_02280 [Chitinispirillales bacterium]|jgi:hypothetical protein|nr:hypothetical protein [Chitinispirillales bacterium]